MNTLERGKALIRDFYRPGFCQALRGKEMPEERSVDDNILSVRDVYSILAEELSPERSLSLLEWYGFNVAILRQELNNKKEAVHG